MKSRATSALHRRQAASVQNAHSGEGESLVLPLLLFSGVLSRHGVSPRKMHSVAKPYLKANACQSGIRETVSREVCRVAAS